MDYKVIREIKAFFTEYETGFNRALGDISIINVEGTAGSLSDFFIEAGPHGVTCGKNDE